jgi:hypothetical protein
MDVESVVCGDALCRIDIVRIFWNQLGQFERFVLPAGVELEKAEGKNFSKEDYEKLDIILTNEISPLKDVYKEEIVGPASGEGVDATTGATVLLEKSAYVEGAVWTSYSLWHWVHGGATRIIRNITADARSLDELRDYLRGENVDFQTFALEQFSRRKIFVPQTVEPVISAIVNTSKLLKQGMLYLELAPIPVFEASVISLIKLLDSENRIKCLNAVLKTNLALSQEFYEQLSFGIPVFQNFQEIHLFLQILQTNNAVSPEIIRKIMPLLDSMDFLIARRTYWFLLEQALSEQERNVLRAFYSINKERL